MFPKIPPQKLQEWKDAIKTSKRLLGLLWNIDKVLFLGVAVAAIIPGILPFINGYIYKLIIDLVVSAVNSGFFDITKLYPLLGLRVLTYFLMNGAFVTQ